VRRVLPPRFRVWTLVSAGFAESSFLLVGPHRFQLGSITVHGFLNGSCWDTAFSGWAPEQALLELTLLVPAASYLERRWGMDGFIKFAAVVHVGSAVAAAIYLLFAFVVSGDLDTLYGAAPRPRHCCGPVA